MCDLQEVEKFAIELALAAGKMIFEAGGKKKSGLESTYETKLNFADLVTETDKAVEAFLFGEIKKRFPAHKTIGEESSSSDQKVTWTDEMTWIIDPIDGTTNFVHGFPMCCVSIGITLKKQTIFGVINAPFIGKLFTARKSRGAWCNGKPISVTSCSSLNKALVLFEEGPRGQAATEELIKNVQSVLHASHSVRCLGSAALSCCFVADGSADCYFQFGDHCWDIAAGALIVQEAGGIALDPSGSPLQMMGRRVLCAANESLAKELSSKILHHTDFGQD